jgi:aldehyde dehydrogenase (NAD+)
MTDESTNNDIESAAESSAAVPATISFDLDYAPAPESTSVVSIADEYGLFIGGKFVAAQSDESITTLSPSTEEPLSQIAVASEADVDRAMAAARTAQTKVWGPMPGRERAKYLFRIARQLQERGREFAVLETMDGGKPIKESRDVDIPLAAAHFFYNAGWADKLEYAFPGRKVAPRGVAGQIIPWNFPMLMLAWKVAPALATGNTVVLKPAETTPLTALLFAQLLQDVGLPDGVVNIVTGAGPTGAALVEHRDVDKLAFTGSTAVGKQIQRSAAARGIPLTLELGGKAAHIVFEDAAIEQAVEGVINGIYFNQGHVCCAGSRLLVQESIAEEFVGRLKRRLATVRVGDPLDKNTDVGAINSAAQLGRIEALVESGVAEGAVLYQPECSLPERGYWFKPTIFTNVQQSHQIARDEIFGPVLSVLTFRTPEEAVAKANDTPYGLSAGIWTEKGSKILWMADQLDAGVVWANTFNQFDPTSPFGGYKESGFGREGGLHGLAPYVSHTPMTGGS